MEVTGKFVIVHDTICDGLQCQMDGDGSEENRKPTLYDNEADAMHEIFADAIAGLEGTDDDYFDENDLNKEKVVSEMRELLHNGEFDDWKNFLEENQACNYYGEWIESADEFILGRKTFFTGEGVVIAGTKLEDL
jgi:hypothetical protein